MTWIYPYRTLFGDVSISIAQITIDGAELPDELFDPDHRRAELVLVEKEDWERATVRFEVNGPPSELKQLREDGIAPQAIGVLHSGPTNTRLAIDLEADKNELSRWTGEVELVRFDWFGQVSLRAVVVGEVDGVPHRYLGAAPEWALLLDDTPRPPIHGAIRMRWDDFSEPEHLDALSSYQAEPAFLHLDPDEPILYLNRIFEGLEALLEERRRRPAAEQALHDQTRATLATEAWAAMFNASLLAIREDDNGVDWPESQWQRTALEILFHRIFPEKTPDDALREAAAMRQEDTGGNSIEQLLMPAVSAHVSVAKLLRSSINRLSQDTQEVASR